jgi:hypothetical protein
MLGLRSFEAHNSAQSRWRQRDGLSTAGGQSNSIGCSIRCGQVCCVLQLGSSIKLMRRSGWFTADGQSIQKDYDSIAVG